MNTFETELDLGDLGLWDAVIHYEVQTPEPSVGIPEAVIVKKVIARVNFFDPNKFMDLDVTHTVSEGTIEILEQTILENMEYERREGVY